MKKKSFYACVILLLIISGCVFNNDELNVITEDSNAAQLETPPVQLPTPVQPDPLAPSSSPAQPDSQPQPPTHTETSIPTDPPIQLITPTQPTLPPIPISLVLPAFVACPVDAAEAFLSQYISMFFYTAPIGHHNIAPETFMIANRRDILDDDGWSIDWHPYFTDVNGVTIENVPFIQNLYGAFSGDLNKPAPVVADTFQIYTIYGSDYPLLIVVQFRAFQFTGGAYIVFEIFDNGNEFLQLGSMIPWWSGGGAIPALYPFINESGEIIAYEFAITSGHVFRLTDEGDFEGFWMFSTSTLHSEFDGWHPERVLANDFAWMLIDYEVNQSTSTRYRDLLTDLYHRNFVPMVRMYDLEDYLHEKIMQQLRGFVPVFDVD